MGDFPSEHWLYTCDMRYTLQICMYSYDTKTLMEAGNEHGRCRWINCRKKWLKVNTGTHATHTHHKHKRCLQKLTPSLPNHTAETTAAAAAAPFSLGGKNGNVYVWATKRADTLTYTIHCAASRFLAINSESQGHYENSYNHINISFICKYLNI